MPWQPSPYRPAITEALLSGETPYQVAKRFPTAYATVYNIAKELRTKGQLPETDIKIPDREYGVPDKPITPTEIPLTAVSEKGIDTVSLGEKSLPQDAVNRIRGILGISARPKVLSMPMPEMLYPAMVIAVTELGFQPMRPDDFIDTVLYQWLEACGYIPGIYIKKSELQKLAERPDEKEMITRFEIWAKGKGLVTMSELESYAKSRGLMSFDEWCKQVGINPSDIIKNNGNGDHQDKKDGTEVANVEQPKQDIKTEVASTPEQQPIEQPPTAEHTEPTIEAKNIIPQQPAEQVAEQKPVIHKTDVVEMVDKPNPKKMSIEELMRYYTEHPDTRKQKGG